MENNIIGVEESTNLKDLGKEKLTECLVKAVRDIMKWKSIDKNRLKGQIKNCMEIINGIMDDKKEFLISAPTGFGKTILALMVTEMFKNAEIELNTLSSENGGSYILTPNKLLQDQYNDDIVKFNLTKSHSQIKGQSNYVCDENNELTFATRPCSKISISKLPLKKSCGSGCSYIVAREKAIKSKTTIFNYSYFLAQMNKVFGKMGGKSPFKPRTLTIFDEGHTLEKIVTDTFTTEFDMFNISHEITNGITEVETIFSGVVGRSGSYDDGILRVKSVGDWFKNNNGDFIKLVKSTLYSDNVVINNKTIMNFIDKIYDKFNIVEKFYTELITAEFPDLTDEDVELTDTQLSIVESFKYIQNFKSELDDISERNREIGIEYLVADVIEVNTRQKGVTKEIVTFRCEKTDELNIKHVLDYSNYIVIMSATIGDSKKEVDMFAKENGFNNYKMVINKSDFDFSMSPIITIDPPLKMSFKEKEANMPKMLQRVRDIVEFRHDRAGLIHTGNYEFQNRLKQYVESNNIHQRFMFCSNAKEKFEAIRQMKWDIEQTGSTNRVLVGASLLEGVDLKDELCRFEIFMKVPFQSLKDVLVKRKMNRIDGWYSWSTMISFLQGIGRGVRHKKDWCEIFLLDGSFNGFFYNYGILPRIIRGRSIVTTIHAYFLGKEKKNTSPPITEPLPVIDDLSLSENDYNELKPNDIFGGM